MTATALPHPATRRAAPRLLGLLATIALSAPTGTATLLFFGAPAALATIAFVTLLCWPWWRSRAADRQSGIPAGATAGAPPPARRPRPAQL